MYSTRIELGAGSLGLNYMDSDPQPCERTAVTELKKAAGSGDKHLINLDPEIRILKA